MTKPKAKEWMGGDAESLPMAWKTAPHIDKLTKARTI